MPEKKKSEAKEKKPKESKARKKHIAVAVEKKTTKAMKEGKKVEKPKPKKAVEEKEPKKEKREAKKKPRALKVVPEWVEYSGKQVEELIVQLANAGKTSSEIGMVLRDQYGIPNVKVVAGKRVLEVMAENKLEGKIPADLLNLIRKSVVLQKHIREHKHDQSAKRGYGLTVSKIRKLVNYYHSKKKLPEGWRYSPEEAELLVK